MLGADDVAAAPNPGRRPGRRGQATRQRLLDCTLTLLATTSWRSIKVIDIARAAGMSPASFYQYFENVEQAIGVLAEDLVEQAGDLTALVDGDWSEVASWATARSFVEGFLTFWERNRAVFRVVDLATEEGDRRFHALRVQALNAVTVTLARVIAIEGGIQAGTDPMAVAATVISMLAHVASHQYGYEFWGIRTSSMVDSQSRIVHWVVTGRLAPSEVIDVKRSSRPRTGPVVGGGAARSRIESARRRTGG